jgi:hypothetical protein
VSVCQLLGRNNLIWYWQLLSRTWLILFLFLFTFYFILFDFILFLFYFYLFLFYFYFIFISMLFLFFIFILLANAFLCGLQGQQKIPKLTKILNMLVNIFYLASREEVPIIIPNWLKSTIKDTNIYTFHFVSFRFIYFKF